MTVCILWTGYVRKDGYGWRGGGGSRGSYLVHRYEYEKQVGPIPEGLILDHTCHNIDLSCKGGRTCLHRRCINVEHLEPVTHQENLLRSAFTLNGRNAKKTHCPQGHEYTEANTHKWNGKRECRLCSNARRAARSRRQKAKVTR